MNSGSVRYAPPLAASGVHRQPACFANAPRCKAMSRRTGRPCQAPAVHGKSLCAIHGRFIHRRRTDRMQGILVIRRATLQLIAKYKLERLFDNLAFRLASWERRMNVAL